MYFIALLLILISIYYSCKKQHLLVFVYSFVVSPSDSGSLAILLDKYFSSFSYIMESILFLTCIICIIQNHNRRKIRYFEKCLNVCYAFLIVSFVLVFLQESGISSFSRVIAYYIEFVSNYGIASLLILLLCIEKYDIRQFLIILTLSHCILALFTIYGSYIGLHFIDILNYDHYYTGSDDYTVRNQSPILVRQEFLTVLINKWDVHVGSQFANSNILGFYSGSLVFLSILLILENKKYLLGDTIMMVIGLLLWLDAGTRAPLFSVFVLFLTRLIIEKKHFLYTLILLPVTLIIIIAVYTDFLSSTIFDSINTRTELIDSQWSFFVNHMLIGPSYKEITFNSPHQLWLLYATRFGLIGLLFSIIFFYIIPLFLLVKNKSLNYKSISLYCLLVFTSNTNNYTALILFNTLFVYLLSMSYPSSISNPIKIFKDYK